VLIFKNRVWHSNFSQLCESRVNIGLQDMSTSHCLKVLQGRPTFLFFTANVVLAQWRSRGGLGHGRPQKLSQGGAKPTFCLSCCGCWRCNANLRI